MHYHVLGRQLPTSITSAGSVPVGSVPGPAAERRRAPPRFSRTTPNLCCRTTWQRPRSTAAGIRAIVRRRPYSFRVSACHYFIVDPRAARFPFPLPGPAAPGMAGGGCGLLAPIRPHPRLGGRWERPGAPGGCGEGPVALLPALGPVAGAERRGGGAGPPQASAAGRPRRARDSRAAARRWRGLQCWASPPPGAAPEECQPRRRGLP